MGASEETVPLGGASVGGRGIGVGLGWGGAWGGVVVGIAVAVGAASACLETVCHYTEEGGSGACEGLVETLRYVAAVAAHAADDDHAVDLPQKREGIGDRGQRWSVDHDEVVLRLRLLEQAGLQGDLEELLRCPVHVATTRGLRHARESTREQIEREARRL